jgi:hypothetical protein
MRIMGFGWRATRGSSAKSEPLSHSLLEGEYLPLSEKAGFSTAHSGAGRARNARSK